MPWNRQLSRSRSQSYKGFFFSFWKWLTAFISRGKLRCCSLVTAWRIKALCSHCHYCCLLTILLMLHIPSPHPLMILRTRFCFAASCIAVAARISLRAYQRKKPSYCLALQKKQEKREWSTGARKRAEKMIDASSKERTWKGEQKTGRAGQEIWNRRQTQVELKKLLLQQLN